MSRVPRRDAPGVLHHVMARGLERRAIFRGDQARADFVQRLAALADAQAWTVSAGAHLSNHVHLLVRTGRRPLAAAMRARWTGYAGGFNRRHQRCGHLFQARYKSIVVEAEPYFLELVRSLHRNPLRARVVADRRALDRYPWAGHGVLVGRRAAIDRARSEIDLLREYRTRPVADGVIGKLDVREAAAQLPEEADEAEPLDEADTLPDAEERAADDRDAVPEEAEA